MSNYIKYLLLGFSFIVFSVKAQTNDLIITQILDNEDPIARGAAVVYTVNFLNSGNDPTGASGVEIIAPVPPGTSFNSGLSDPSCSENIGVVICDIGSLPGIFPPATGSRQSISLAFDTNAMTANQIDVSVDISGSLDDNPANNDLLESTTVINGADMEVTKSANPDPVSGGEETVWTIVVKNNGPDPADGIEVIDILPPNLEFVSFAGTGWNCIGAKSNISCNYSTTLIAGETAPNLLVTTKVTGSLLGTQTNSIEVVSSVADPENSNNNDDVNITINPGADLIINKSAPTPNPVPSGGIATFTLSVENLGPFDAENIIVTDPLPTGFTLNDASGNGWDCSASTTIILSCSMSNLSVGIAEPIILETIAPTTTTPDVYVNTAFVDSTTEDPEPTNNNDDTNVSILPDAIDLDLTKTKGPTPIAEGNYLHTRIDVINNGPLDALPGETIVVDTYNPSLEMYSGFSGNGWSCSETSSDQVTCIYNNTLGSGEAAPRLTISFIVLTESDSITNTACAETTNPNGDWRPENDCDSANAIATLTEDSVDLAVTKETVTEDGDNILSSSEDTVIYKVSVTNNGNAPAGNTVLRDDEIPGYINNKTTIQVAQVDNTTNTSFGCSINGAKIRCTQNSGEINPGETVFFEITVTRPLADGTFTNEAIANPLDRGDLNRADNNDTSSITIEPIADVEMQSKTFNPQDSVISQTQGTYTISFRNNGPSVAKNVVIEDTIETNDPNDSGFILLDINPSKGTCNGLSLTPSIITFPAPVLTCNIGDLAPGEVGVINIEIEPLGKKSINPRVYTNTATISSDTVEATDGSNGTSNTAMVEFNVEDPESDILLNINDANPAGPDPLGYTPNPTPGTLDNIIVYEMTVTNLLSSDIFFPGVIFDYLPPDAKEASFVGFSTTPPTVETDLTDNASLCSLTSNQNEIGPNTISVSCSSDDPTLISEGSSKSIYVGFKIVSPPDPTGDIYNITGIAFSNSEDPSPSNNIASQFTTVKGLSDVQIIKTYSNSDVQVYEPYLVELEVTNNGPLLSNEVIVNDNLPEGIKYLTPDVALGLNSPYNKPPYTTGAFWNNSSTGVGDSCVVTGSDITCNLGTLLVNEVVNIKIPVITESDLISPITNNASVQTDAVDNNLANNSSTADVTISSSSISGFVFVDNNINRIMDAGEPPIADVEIGLLGKSIYGQEIFLTTSTDVAGEFLFTNIPPSVEYRLIQRQPEAFTDLFETPGTSGGVSNDSNIGDEFIYNSIALINLKGSENATDYLFGEGIPNIISGTVYHDKNNDGINDINEDSISGVTITLSGLNIGVDGIIDTADDIVVSQTTTTDSNGNYSFDTYPGRYTVTIQSHDEEPLKDTWVPGIRSAGLIDGSPCNTCSVGFDNIGNIEVFTTPQVVSEVNFGEALPNIISGSVYHDQNNNGTLEAGEPGINGVTITLTGSNVGIDGIIDTADDILVTKETITDTNGEYNFVTFPGRYTVTIQSHDEVPLKDNWSPGLRSTGLINGSPCTTCTPNINSISNIELFNLEDNSSSLDFAELKPASLSGFVFEYKGDNELPYVPGAITEEFDPNRDDLISNITIKIMGNDPYNNPISYTTETDTSGAFLFSGLIPGKYTLEEIQPVDYTDYSQKAGNLGGDDSVELNKVLNILLPQDAVAENYIFGEFRTILPIKIIPVPNNRVLITLFMLLLLSMILLTYRRKLS